MIALKGNIVFSKDSDKLTIIENGFIGVEDNEIVFVSETLPGEYKNLNVTDYGDKLIIPGFCDLHTHAPQFENIGLGMNMKLLPWLDQLTFPTEAKYGDLDYAKTMYQRLISALIRYGTTRAVLFATVHTDSAQLLIDLMNEAGLCGYVGKVNMDINCPDFLCENTEQSLKETQDFLEKNQDTGCVQAIITPRFVPSCSREMLKGLGELAKTYHAPIQSHINENLEEIQWVAELYPEADNYADAYDRFGLLNDKTLMAHCIHMKPEEIDLLVKRGVYAVHCPDSNANISSGMMPLKNLMKAGMRVGLGSDISGGHEINIAQSMVLAMQISKLRYQQNPDEGFLTFAEAFYLATKGGGSFFGKVGSFEPGYAFDALVIDDENLSTHMDADVIERLSRFVYIGDDRNIVARYINGREIKIS